MTDAHIRDADSVHLIDDAWAKTVACIGKNFSSGSWPYISGAAPSTEATAWCMLALRNGEAANKANLAAQWLIDKQNADGGWSTAPAAGKSDWTSGPALLALRIIAGENAAGQSAPAIKRALEYMFDSRTEYYGSLARLLLFISKGPIALDYARGWPWSRDCYHWIEPTVYALLALKLPHRLNSGIDEEIVGRAEQFIWENECHGGGWNHGNMYCLNFYLPPYVVTTGEALLALQQTPESGGVKAAIQFLISKEPTDFTALEHAWSILALNAHGQPTDKLVDSLARRQNHDGSFGLNLMSTALACLALDTAVSKKNPLKMTNT
ncbi:MAG TPA: hypothetical protein V6C69_22740 [Trichormus sp.]